MPMGVLSSIPEDQLAFRYPNCHSLDWAYTPLLLNLTVG